MILGAVIFTGIVPLAITNSSSITNLSVSCSATNSCIASATLQNINVTNGALTVWFSVYDSSGITVFTDSKSVNIQPTQTQTVTDSLSNLATGQGLSGQSGLYTLKVFANNNYGTIVSLTSSTQFSPLPLLVLTPECSTTGCTKVSAVPAGTPATCPITVGILFANQGLYCATYPQGQTVTLVQKIPASSGILNGPASFVMNCLWLGTGFGCANQNVAFANGTTLTMNRSYALDAIVNQLAPPPNSVIINANSVYGGAWSPAQATVSALSPSATFGFTPTANSSYIKYHLASWSVVLFCSFNGGAVTQQTAKSGTNGSFSVNWSWLSKFASQGCGDGNIISKANVFNYISLNVEVQSNSGITTTPAVGTYYYPSSQQVTVSMTIAKGYCFNGWIYDGQSLGNKSSVTVTVTGADTILASGASAVGKCQGPPPPPPPPSGGGSALNYLLGGGLVVLGSIGYVRSRRKR